MYDPEDDKRASHRVGLQTCTIVLDAMFSPNFRAVNWFQMSSSSFKKEKLRPLINIYIDFRQLV